MTQPRTDPTDPLHGPSADAPVVDAPSSAAVILETIPGIMRAIRSHMREGIAGLSVPQFRVLQYVRRHPGTDLSGISEHLGTTLPATSELVARLVRQGLLTREPDERERRRACIELTAQGQAGLDEAQARTLRWLSSVVGALDSASLLRLVGGLRDLADALAANDVLAAGDGPSDRNGLIETDDGARAAGTNATDPHR